MLVTHLKKLFSFLGRVITILVVLGLGYVGSIVGLYHLGQYAMPINISGTGSMYPSFDYLEDLDELAQQSTIVATPHMYRFPGGIQLGELVLLRHELSHGDIVSFSNDATRKILQQDVTDSSRMVDGFVKRVVGLGGDTIEVRNGYLYRNGEPLLEPYTYSPRSTFGGVFLAECAELEIPKNYVFVVGDHRKISNDSRDELGLIHISDIDHFIPFETQTDLQARWRDPSQDLSNEDLPILDLDEYLKSINTLRQQAGVKPLTYVSQLEQSALTRATIILESGDLSFDGETSGVSTRIAMQRAGYSNIIWGEIPILGYYTAQELAQAVASSPSHKEFLTNSEFEDLGISVQIGEMNNCPTQIVVQHFGGYRPPDYSEADKSGWRDTVDSAEKSLASWIELREAGEVYENNKDDIEKIISLLNERVQISRRISAKVISNQWLSTADQNDISRFSSIGTEVTGLISAFNRKMRGE